PGAPRRCLPRRNPAGVGTLECEAPPDSAWAGIFEAHRADTGTPKVWLPCYWDSAASGQGTCIDVAAGIGAMVTSFYPQPHQSHIKLTDNGWEVEIRVAEPGFNNSSALWVGTQGGATPAGTYIKTGGAATGPSAITVVAVQP
ncbi:MAG: hypothetical protein J7M14_02910, partial [Planctomycetes bacterium]|nr:hypothetical protein [Planctomycetota bacterium]